jgi:hypothetical protein
MHLYDSKARAATLCSDPSCNSGRVTAWQMLHKIYATHLKVAVKHPVQSLQAIVVIYSMMLGDPEK